MRTPIIMSRRFDDRSPQPDAMPQVIVEAYWERGWVVPEGLER